MRWVLGIVVAAALSACAPRVSFTPLNQPPTELHGRNGKDVAWLDAPPSRPHVEIGTLVGKEGVSGPDSDEMVRAVKAEAGRRGCEAVWINGRVRHGHQYACIVYVPSALVLPPPYPPSSGPTPHESDAPATREDLLDRRR